MNAFVTLPIEARMAILFVAGSIVGACLNAAVLALEMRPSARSPWSRSFPRDERSSMFDRVPILGWWRLRRFSTRLRSWFWLRPMLVELFTGALWAALYWWEIDQRGLLRGGLPLNADLLIAAHHHYFAHIALICFLIVAALIDADETLIPDAVTLPGTLVGLLIAGFISPWSLPPVGVHMAAGRVEVEFLTLASPNGWPNALAPAPHFISLLIVVACFTGWCFALLPRVWRPSRGLRKAVAIFFAFWVRTGAIWLASGALLLGAVASIVTWRWGGPHWQAFASAVVGVAAGGGMVWAFRIGAGWVLGVEALGFGDVTLMAMIGAFLGWQGVMLTFFLAPLAGVCVAVTRWCMGYGNVLPFGPYLCSAAVCVIVFWKSLWRFIAPPLAIPWLVPLALVVSLALLVAMLAAWRALRGMLVQAD